MTPEEFVIQAREVLQQALTNLQTTTLLNSQLEQQILETGRSLQTLSRLLDALSLPDYPTENGQLEPPGNGQPD
jgi:hypothetical protein